MEQREIVVDLNARIDNLQCNISVNNSVPYAEISFMNLGFGIITAIKFVAKGYNAFGDVVPVNSSDEFSLIIQDIYLDVNHSLNKCVSLPNNDIRRLNIDVQQICYSGGSVFTYKGRQELIIHTSEYSTAEKETVEAIHDTVSSLIRFLPVDTEKGWLCGCGRFNDKQLDKCSLCGTDKELMFDTLKSDFVSIAIKKHNQNELNRREEAAALLKEKKRSRIKKTVYASLLIAIIAIISVFIGHSILLSGRRTFSSVEEMRESVKGEYVYYDKNGSGEYSVTIYNWANRMVFKYLKWNASNNLEIKEWDYKNGTIDAVWEWVVTKDGNLKRDGEIYYKRR